MRGETGGETAHLTLNKTRERWADLCFKSLSSAALMCLLSLAVVSAHASPLSALLTPTTLAVLEFTGEVELSVAQRRQLSDLVRAEATSLLTTQVSVLTREQMSELSDSAALLEAAQSGRALDVGRALQARWLITGELSGEPPLLNATLRLYEVSQGVSVDLEFANDLRLDELSVELRSMSAKLLSHVMSARGEGELADIDLPSERLPEAFELSASDTLGLPVALLKQYDEALIIDEAEDASLHRKIEVWAKLSRYQRYQRLHSEARRRLSYWQERLKRRLQCERSWRQLEQLLELKRALEQEKKDELIESFLDACGRDERENPSLNAPYFVNKRLEAERQAREAREEEEREAREAREKEEREARKEARKEAREEAQKQAQEAKDQAISARISKHNERHYSVLETHVGKSYALEAGELGAYQLRVRLQPHSWWARRVFFELQSSFVRPESLQDAQAAQEAWRAEWSASLGVQKLNEARWAPSLSVGYQHRSGEHKLLTELGLRAQLIPELLHLHLGLQYLPSLSAQGGQPLPKGRLPRTFVLDDRPGDELRLTLWASTGLLGMSLVLLAAYGLSQL